jgi:hypothetical protein
MFPCLYRKLAALDLNGDFEWNEEFKLTRLYYHSVDNYRLLCVSDRQQKQREKKFCNHNFKKINFLLNEILLNRKKFDVEIIQSE